MGAECLPVDELRFVDPWPPAPGADLYAAYLRRSAVLVKRQEWCRRLGVTRAELDALLDDA